MIDAPHAVQTTRQPVAMIRLTIPRSEMMTAFGPAVNELIAAVTSQGIGPAGAVFAHHHRITPDTFDFELGVPVTGAVEETGRVKASELPAAKVVRTIYRGPYEGLPAAWGDFEKWIAANGYKSAENLWECYVEGPHSKSDSSEYETELNRPIR